MTLTKKDKFYIGIWAVIGLCIIIFLFAFLKKKEEDNSNFRELIKAKEETIRIIREKRTSDSLFIVERDKNIALRLQNDSIYAAMDLILQKEFDNNKERHALNQQEYDKIPSDIRKLTPSQLEREITNFYKR